MSVEMNGNFEVMNIRLNPNLDSGEQEKILVECLNEAREKIQKTMAKSLMDSGIGF